MTYEFDRYLRYDELAAWLRKLADEHPTLVAVESYGTSHEGRDLLLVTVTDATTGPAESKPAHWVDASIHAVELTATVAACALLAHLVEGHAGGDETVTRALATRTFYVVPRVNPDGAEWALADSPRFRRSSTRPWPWSDAHRWPGTYVEDVDGDGRVLQMRIADPDGAWIADADDARLMIPIQPDGAPVGATRYRLIDEGTVIDHDGFTIPTPRPPEGLDLNRNFPAGWSTTVHGSGDHPLSEPEIAALVRAVVARPNVCGYNAFHTSGAVLLRPSSTRPDSALPPGDVWVWKQLGEIGTRLTHYPVHSVFEDFTWNKSDTMSGAADDWAYEHLGVFSWTTEFWDIVHAATGQRQGGEFWYVGPTDEQARAVLAWCDEHAPDQFVDWYGFEHPQLGPVELGGWHYLGIWTNPPLRLLRAEVTPHARFAVAQALAAPCLEVKRAEVTALGDDTWRVELGVANTGWLPTFVSARAKADNLVLPIVAELSVPEGGGVAFIGGEPRQRLGQLEGRAAMRFSSSHDGTPDRTLASWVVRAAAGTVFTLRAHHPRAGTATAEVVLGTQPNPMDDGL